MNIRTSSPKARGPSKAASAKIQKAALKRFLDAGMRRVDGSPRGTAAVTVTTTYTGKNETFAIVKGYPPIPPSWLLRDAY